jgi:tetratricopeptide (TPR) repeat protein
MNLHKIFLTGLIVTCLITRLNAQKSLVNTLPDQDYKIALELFEKQKYADAQHAFQKVIENRSTYHTGSRANAQYYSALCALELFNPDAEHLLTTFINENPENNKVNEAYFSMARHHYNSKKYNDALGWLEKVDAKKLNPDQKAEYHFEAGYCYFLDKKNEKARVHFFEIKDVDTKYTAPALYYYSHIAYDEKNYETALEGFLRLRDDETFSPIVPYYITQIYFLQKKYDKVTEYAPPLLDSVVEKRMGEMSRMIGESYCRLDKFKEALPYLEKYAEKTPSMSPDDRYQLGYAYYKAGDMPNAIKSFEPITNAKTALSQNALYHLADCYLRTKNKAKARMAFSSAASMDFNPEIKEISMFNYAVATYELSLSAFNETIKVFNEYLRLYPYSSRSDEAFNYLVLAYMSTKDYHAALESLSKIKKKNSIVNRAHQRIAFFRGLELYNNLQFDQAIGLFDESLEYSEFDNILAARAYYWKGEALYRLKEYTLAMGVYSKFMGAPGAASLEEYEQVQYNTAYSYFNLKKYDEALDWFRRYTASTKDTRRKTVADSYNRIGDCFFMKLSYWVAIENYEKAIALGASDADYALFQKGFCLGLVNRQEKKITFLSQLLTDYPKSAYVDDGLYEIGRAYCSTKQTDKGIESFNKILTDFPTSSYVPKALLQLGLLYFNMDKHNEAIASYKKVVEQFPGTADARNALNGLKTVYMDKNDADSYFAYLKSKGDSIKVRISEQDSLTYTAAENIYMAGDCDKSAPMFTSYIERFKDGSFLLNSNFYLADCNLKNNKTDDALKGFEYVISKPRSMFTEQALAAASAIHYSKAEYAAALALYKRLETEAELKNNILEAKMGEMRCNFRLNDFTNAITSAKTLITTEKVADETKREAHYILAKAYLETKNQTAATDELKLVSKETKSAEGAECKYLLAQQYYNLGKKDLAQKEISNFIEKNTPHQFWLGKSFILLSDIYVDKKDEFQAVHTLQSILDYYEIANDGIKAEAKEKKDTLVARNAKLQIKEKQPDLELNMDNKKLQ